MVKRRLVLTIGIAVIALGAGLLWPGKWLSPSFHHKAFYSIMVSVQYLIHGYSSIDFDYANDHLSELVSGFNNYFDRIIVLQRCSTANRTPWDDNKLNPAYKLSPTHTIKCSAQSFISIFEVLQIG